MDIIHFQAIPMLPYFAVLFEEKLLDLMLLFETKRRLTPRRLCNFDCFGG
jgi:hypothetical protein